MAAINFCLFNVDGYVIAGDSLKMDHDRVWKTISTPQGGGIRELTGSVLLKLSIDDRLQASC